MTQPQLPDSEQPDDQEDPGTGDPFDNRIDMGAFEVLRRGLASSPELRSGIGVTLLMALSAAVGRLVIPIVIQQILDRGVLGEAGYRPGFVWLASAFALLVILAVLLVSRSAYLRLVNTAEAVLHGLRVRAFTHIHRLGMADHDATRRGVLVARVTADVEALAAFAQWGAIAWIVNSAIIAGTLVVMSLYSWKLTVVVVAIHLPLIPFLKWVQRRQFDAYGLVRSRVAETLGLTSETVSGAPVIRAYGYEKPVRDRLDDSIDRQYHQQMKAHLWFAGMLPVVDFFSSVSLAGAIAVGVWWQGSLGLGLGELIAFIFLVALMLNPISELGEVLDQTQTALAGWAKIQQVMDMEIEVVEPSGGSVLPPGPLSVAAVGVGHRYRTGPVVLGSISIDIPADANVAVVGETGSGKTTFVRMLARLADPTVGRIEIGGIDLRLVAPESRHASIRMVPQDGFLFDTTVCENIRFGRPGASRRDVERAVAELGLDRWIQTLPRGIDSQVGERGGRLSAGERQLVALVRAQVADPGLLILDEATSSVDPETEEALSAAMNRLAVGRTTVAVAHRLTTAERADLIIVFESGAVVQTGTHTELVRTPGIYRRLHEQWMGNTRHRI